MRIFGHNKTIKADNRSSQIDNQYFQRGLTSLSSAYILSAIHNNTNF